MAAAHVEASHVNQTNHQHTKTNGAPNCPTDGLSSVCVCVSEGAPTAALGDSGVEPAVHVKEGRDDHV